MMKLFDFIQRSQSLEVYGPGEPVEVLAKRLGRPSDSILKLNANENLFLPRSLIQSILEEAATETDPRLYPSGEERTLAEKLARIHGLSEDQFIIASGGDQLIDLVLSSFVKRTESVLVVTPTFSMYPHTANIRELHYKAVQIDSYFNLDPEMVLAESRDADMVILCNPNNPTSNQFPREAVTEIVEGYENLVLIDEAYAEFGRYTLIEEAAERENLVVLRTFSKAYGMAGLRLGYAVTNTVIAQILAERYMVPYPVPNIVLRTGAKILDEQRLVLETVEEIKQERNYTVESLNEIEGVEAFRSDTNFVLFNTDMPYEEVYSKLLENGIIVRKIGEVPGHDNCLRVTVAPREIMARFLTALREVME
jgi:histidinol-phosphate aminotransferase